MQDAPVYASAIFFRRLSPSPLAPVFRPRSREQVRGFFLLNRRIAGGGGCFHRSVPDEATCGAPKVVFVTGHQTVRATPPDAAFAAPACGVQRSICAAVVGSGAFPTACGGHTSAKQTKRRSADGTAARSPFPAFCVPPLGTVLSGDPLCPVWHGSFPCLSRSRRFTDRRPVQRIRVSALFLHSRRRHKTEIPCKTHLLRASQGIFYVAFSADNRAA